MSKTFGGLLSMFQKEERYREMAKSLTQTALEHRNAQRELKQMRDQQVQRDRDQRRFDSPFAQPSGGFATATMTVIDEAVPRWDTQLMNAIGGPRGRSISSIAIDDVEAEKTMPETKPDVVAELLKVEDAPSAKYLELAEKLEVQSPFLIDTAFRVFLQREEIFVYPYEKVAQFMNWTVKQEEQRLARDPRTKLRAGDYLRWTWKPLRMKDSSSYGGQLYNKAVPLHALEKVDAICEKFPQAGELTFSVTDYEVVRPDPFLMVRVNGCETKYVIDHWDEPHFHMDLLK